jgi:hypothetical protein
MSETDALIAVIAVSDAGVESKSAISALESGDVSSIVEAIVEDSKVSDIISEATTEEKAEEKAEEKPTGGPTGGPIGGPIGGPDGSSYYDNDYDKLSFTNISLNKEATIKFGEKEVSVESNGKFSTDVEAGEKLNDFLVVDLTNVYNELKDNTQEFTGVLLVEVKDLNNTENSATIVLKGATIKNNKITFKKEITNIGIIINGLTKVANDLDVKEGETYTTSNINKDYTHTGVVFDINHIIEGLPEDKQTKINKALNDLDEYFQQSGKKYSITIVPTFYNVTNDEGVKFTPSKISGTFEVK